MKKKSEKIRNHIADKLVMVSMLFVMSVALVFDGEVGERNEATASFINAISGSGAIVQSAGINKNLSNGTLIIGDARYEDGVSNEEDSAAVWRASNPADSLLFITHKNDNSVTGWSLQTGKQLYVLTGFSNPNGVAVDQAEGALYVTDRQNYAIKKFKIASVVAGSTSPDLVFGNNFTKSKEPMGVTVYDKNGVRYIYATYIGSSTKYVRAFTTEGVLYRDWTITNATLESIKADNENGLIYVSDESSNLVKVYTDSGVFVRDFGGGVFFDDPEGIDVYECDSDGYIIVSDQKINEFKIFDRKSYAYLAKFSVKDVVDTDGITLVQSTLPNYPNGGFFAQSRDRFVEGVRWEKIKDVTQMTLCLDGVFAGGTPDSEPPSTPEDAVAIPISSSRIDVAWNASTDNVGVSGYRIRRNGVVIAETPITSYQDSGLAAETLYTYTVEAYDAAGNTSAESAEVSATTFPQDLTPPTIFDVQTTDNTANSVLVVWSTDEEGDSAVEYGVTTNYGNVISDSQPQTEHAVFLANLSSNTLYHYRVTSKDNAGNSAASGDYVFQTLGDETPPITTVNPQAGTFAGIVTVTMGVNESATIYYTLDGTTPTKNSLVYTTPLTFIKDTTLMYFAVDLAGNEEEVRTENYVVAATEVNKNITSPQLPIEKTIRYDDGVSGDEDSVAVWVAPNPEESLLFVTHKSSNEVKVWDIKTGQIVRVLSGFNNPNGLAVDQTEGTLYVTDRLNYSIKKYVIADIIGGNQNPALVFGNAFAKSKEPMGVTIYHEFGNSYVYATYVGSSVKYIRAFRPNGSLYKEWNMKDVSLESIKADDENQLVYVADERYAQVKVYKPDGTFIRSFGQGTFVSEPEGIDVYECGDDGYIIVSDQKAAPTEFEIFDRKNFTNLGRFKINNADDTDGLVIVQESLPNYPEGVLFAQSKDKFIEGVRWERIGNATKMTLCPNGLVE